MINSKFLFGYLFLILYNTWAFATTEQDSLSLFQKINEQYNPERNLKQIMFYNPASMLGYSDISFSDLKISYSQEKKEMYRDVLGSGNESLLIETSSFRKIKNNQVAWGKASYKNHNLHAVKWNENLDYERIAPYITADSLGGDMKVEKYSFEGGFAKSFNRWNLGISGAYTAQIGYRARDPRIENITSDFNILAGAEYLIYKELGIGTFAAINKYTQNNNISFASLLGSPLVYQMTGFGFSNYLFNSKAPNSKFEEMNYKIGFQFFNKKGKDFYLLGSYNSSTNSKYSQNSISNTLLPLTDLKNKFYQIEAAKFFSLKQHRLGIIANHNIKEKSGFEYGYSTNTETITPIYKRENYQNKHLSTILKVLYRHYFSEKSNIAVIPFMEIHRTKEQRINPFSGTKIDYRILGLNLDYRQYINKNQMISWEIGFLKKNIFNTVNALAEINNNNINQWITNDYEYLSSDTLVFHTSLRYDFKLYKLPALFISGHWFQEKINTKKNHSVTLNLGITF